MTQKVLDDLGKLIDGLTSKSRQTKNPNNKYASALRTVKTASTPEEILQALSTNSITWKNNTVMGGKKKQN